MRRALATAVLLCLIISGLSHAEHGMMTKAYVVSVDLEAKALVFRRLDASKKWQEVATAWNEKTEWKDASTNQYEARPATEDLARSLHQDSKVYVKLIDGVLAGLKLLPPTADMD
jgi:hypothetical protein